MSNTSCDLLTAVSITLQNYIFFFLWEAGPLEKSSRSMGCAIYFNVLKFQHWHSLWHRTKGAKEQVERYKNVLIDAKVKAQLGEKTNTSSNQSSSENWDAESKQQKIGYLERATGRIEM